MESFLTLEYWRDEGSYVGRLKEVPEVFTQGESLERLEQNIRDAYLLLQGQLLKADLLLVASE